MERLSCDESFDHGIVDIKKADSVIESAFWGLNESAMLIRNFF